MSKEVRNSVRGAKTACDIWVDLKQRFGTSFATSAYELRGKISSFRQDKLSVSAFYTTLRTYWNELQAGSINPGCSCGSCACDAAQQVRSKEDAEHMFDFLLGLDDAFSVVRTQILSMKPVPTLAEAYQLVEAEEQQRQITRARRPPVEAAAFQFNKERDADDESPRCSHCNKLGHTKETCFKLIGYLGDQRKGRQGSRGDRPRERSFSGSRKQRGEGKSHPHAANVDAEDSPIPGFLADQLARLNEFFSAPLPSHNEPTPHMAGNNPEPYDWIIDSGCNEHIVRDLSWLETVDATGQFPPVRIPNGASIPVTGVGTLNLNGSVKLDRVLHVPQFRCNLLSVSRLTKDNDVALLFLGNVCVLQDLRSRTLIGLGQLHDGLYYLRRIEDLKATGRRVPSAFVILACVPSRRERLLLRILFALMLVSNWCTWIFVVVIDTPKHNTKLRPSIIADRECSKVESSKYQPGV
ncbi:unnamed protein product [Linum trigynum]|uniref:Retrovirus-related Pol polyprotein from transposon TNT 1-94-like beta-barrel domain-containing protein n=1 Tax=Linum trigynum TaxID=586398 RepID=A0AAV2CCL2_9ROSI